MPDKPSTNEQPLDTSEDRRANADWNERSFPTISDQAALAARLQYILKRLEDESWLPLAVRNLIESTCGSLIRLCSSGALTAGDACARVEQLAAEAFVYDELILQSSVLCQIRTLDMELNDYRYPVPPADSDTPSSVGYGFRSTAYSGAGLPVLRLEKRALR